MHFHAQLPKPTVKPHQKSTNPPPFNKNQSIIIVGAGPAGVHMAHLLKKMGFTNVKVLERSHRIGGKSYTIFHKESGEDVPFDMGTCFMHPEYHRTYKLIEEYELGEHYRPGKDVYNKCEMWAPKLYEAKGLPPLQSKVLDDWMFSDVESIALPRYLWWLPDRFQIVTVYKAIERYGKVHRSIFGEYPYTLPPKPDDRTLERIKLPFGKFLESYHLKQLLPLLTLSNAAQGYGLLETVPTLYGLWWNTPRLLSALMSGKPMAEVMKRGYQSIWETIAKKDELDIEFGVQIQSINRNLQDKDAKVIIKALVDKEGSANVKEEKEYTCDFIIVTAPLKEFLPVFTDSTNEEKEIINSLTCYSIITTIYSSDVLNPEEQSITYWPERLEPGTDGQLFAQRNPLRSVFPERELTNPRYGIAYQFYEQYKEGIDKEGRETLIRNLDEAGYKNVKLQDQCVWKYFYHFEQESINKLYPWKLFEMQGQNKTWYAGSSACYESIEDVMCYNHLLVDIYLSDDKPTKQQEQSQQEQPKKQDKPEKKKEVK